MCSVSLHAIYYVFMCFVKFACFLSYSKFARVLLSLHALYYLCTHIIFSMHAIYKFCMSSVKFACSLLISIKSARYYVKIS